VRYQGVTKTALISLCLAILPWSALAKPGSQPKAPTPGHAPLHGADKQLGTPTKNGGIDITSSTLRAVLHPAALGASSSDPKAVTAGHDPMEIQLVSAPKHALKTKIGTVKSLGPAFATKVEVDGTKGSIVLAGKLPADFELDLGHKLVTIAVFEAPTSNAKADKPSVAVFPSIVGLESAPKKGKQPGAKMEPYLAFGLPIVGKTKALFDFDKPLTSVKDSAVSTKGASAAGKDDLGFFASKRIYIGPATATKDGVLGLIAAKGTLTEIGFGIVE